MIDPANPTNLYYVEFYPIVFLMSMLFFCALYNFLFIYWATFNSYIAENFQLFLSDEKLKKRLLSEVDVDKEIIVNFAFSSETQYFR